ncbi:MAG: tRNA pseudouridine(38-40) synthase TruA [Candidatus Thorarchaeota archaeon]|nr:MAG: tRNA pseudouridine(38-40) synthase TruA [Candidatus Thorarchaeota archaeon]
MGVEVGDVDSLTDYAARLFYLGESYHGSQYQPGLKTIQGELIRALSEWSGTPHSTKTVRLCGRTDKGVHSLGQIVVISTGRSLDINRVNRFLPDDIILWASAKSPHSFQPRYSALMRHYRYFLDESWHDTDLSSVRLSITHLIGCHDFELFSKPEPGRNTTTTVLNAAIGSVHGIQYLELFGTSFLWKFVRKLVTILYEVGLGNVEPTIVTDLLNRDQSAFSSGIQPAPPEGLFLIETVVPFRLTSNKYAVSRLRKHLNKRISFFRRSETAYSAVLEQITT